METLKVKFKLNGLEFELEGNENTVKDELKIFKDFVMANFINKLTAEPLQPLIGLPGSEPEANYDQLTEYPPLKEIVMLDLPKSEVAWICVYSLYASDFGKLSFRELDIKNLYESSKRKNDSRMKNFSGNFGKVVSSGWIRILNDEEYLITQNGKDEALKIIKNTNNDIVEGSIKSSVKSKKGKVKIVAKNSLSLVSTLNLNPAKSKSLKEFFSQFSSKSFFEKNLLFIYYMEREAKIEGIGINHIYTCYKNVGEKVPGNLYQSLVDTKNQKGWIDSSNIHNLKITVAGENYVEHDFKKAENK